MNVISLPFKKELSAKRMTTAGVYVNGLWVDGKWQAFKFYASLQPMGPRDFQLLPEGDRFKDTRKLYTETKLLVGSVNKKQAADLVCIDGEWYQVRQVEDWNNHLNLKHYKVIVIRDLKSNEPEAS